MYAEYWENMQSSPDEFVVANHIEALERLRIGGNFLRTSILPLTSLVSNNPKLIEGMSLETIPTIAYSSVMPLTKYSPYTPMFTQ